jgi:hypothetical protein
MTERKSASGEQAGAGKRMTLSQVVESLLNRGSSEHSSVTLSRNAKGETQIEVVVRTGDTGGVETVGEAEELAVEVYERLRARFPMSSGFVGAGPSQ